MRAGARGSVSQWLYSRETEILECLLDNNVTYTWVTRERLNGLDWVGREYLSSPGKGWQWPELAEFVEIVCFWKLTCPNRRPTNRLPQTTMSLDNTDVLSRTSPPQTSHRCSEKHFSKFLLSSKLGTPWVK